MGNFSVVGDVSYLSMHKIFRVERAREGGCLSIRIRIILLNDILRDTIKRLLMLQ